MVPFPLAITGLISRQKGEEKGGFRTRAAQEGRKRREKKGFSTFVLQVQAFVDPSLWVRISRAAERC